MSIYFALVLFTGAVCSLLISALPEPPKLPQRAYQQYGLITHGGRRVVAIRVEIGLREV